MMMSPWFLTPNDTLIRLYRQVVEQELNDELERIIYKEIKRRNLRLDKPTYLKRIK
ncbi:sporulation histidine kinase inhibitor Sda [Priestia filamentosa]|uniref:sporulation histidine kinase inhibitor Sda n=2 Tax=Priestia filamentosa TaxID=1402861 RepID=UPI000A090040|nr:Sporulation inhibitor A [Priestia filamentosa]